MRKKIIAGNWKMNTNLLEGLDLANKVSNLVDKIDFNKEKYQMIIAPPHTHLYSVSSVLNKKIDLSSQNIAAYENGAYTGEISAEMIKNTGAKCTILGHSERRAYFGENNETLSTKLQLALKYDLTPIFCIGEVLEERETGKQFEVVEQQIKNVLFELNSDDFSKVILAYEPVWAIGTGKTASPEQAQEIHAFIRKLISDKYGLDVAENTSILYGGSCKPANADGLFSQPDIDGGLIGGASLNAEDFVKLLKQIIR